MSKKFYVPIEMTKAYVRENEIYATVNGEIIRITPDMIKKIIRNGVVTEVYFSEVKNKEIYDEYMRSVWREEKALEREDRCWIPNGKAVQETVLLVNTAMKMQCFPLKSQKKTAD